MNARDQAAMRIFRDALDADPAERSRLADRLCGDDAALRSRVESLLMRAVDIENDSAVEDSSAQLTLDNAVDPLLGSRLGAFRVIERIGRGGMGVVYRGDREDADFAQTVAIKLIRRGFDFDDVQARFLRERRILARLSHPNIARFIDGGVAADGRPWFAMDFVSGESITRWCDARRLDIRARVRLFLDVCAAVQYAHTQLIVHRDLKPGNVIVDQSGAARLLDFGIARLVGGELDAESTMTMANASYALTPEYAAPEQFTGSAVGVGADVYALGVILYELVAGVGPYALDRSDML
ncbi:MAG: serine/threonine-protein kinase, partial [Dokdonella sp.]